MATVMAYVDGFNLYHGLRSKYGKRYYWLDLPELIRRLRPNDTIVGVRYFTAAIRNDPAGEARQRVYLGALAAHSGSDLEIVMGRYQAKQLSCRSCGVGWTFYEEKETDVNIAVSLVADAAVGASDIALILSADSDLCPAIRMARKVSANLGNQLGIIAVFPPKRQSFEIRSLVSAFTVAQADLRNSLLPLVVTDSASGQSYNRPPTWA